MNWLAHAWPQVLDLLGDHIVIAVPAVLLSIVIAVPIGLFAHRRPRVGGALLGVTTLLYAVPSLALMIIIPALFGVPLRSNATVIIALTFYGTALLVRTAADAFHAVDDAVREAARGIGYSPASIFWKVDLPRAVPLLVAGIRVVAVSTVGLVTIGALVGVAGLGTLFTDGFQRGIIAEVATGLLLTVALALVLDGLCLVAGRLLAPWSAPRRTSRVRAEATA
ncbi:ABC transporter permease [Microbacterium sp. gxy059]|uniref:ABC transporter permease n=1 Tax=Microbacterium sp. gxy059 TaxID=2957199 RepID=UPI003D9569AD